MLTEGELGMIRLTFLISQWGDTDWPGWAEWFEQNRVERKNRARPDSTFSLLLSLTPGCCHFTRGSHQKTPVFWAHFLVPALWRLLGHLSFSFYLYFPTHFPPGKQPWWPEMLQPSCMSMRHKADLLRNCLEKNFFSSSRLDGVRAVDLYFYMLAGMNRKVKAVPEFSCPPPHPFSLTAKQEFSQDLLFDIFSSCIYCC